ncbi:unnamed protein product [Closterium sp. NIES-54]
MSAHQFVAAPRPASCPSCSLRAATCSPLVAPCCCLPFSLRCPAPARPACCAAMASLRVLAFDHEGPSLAPPATANSATRSQWLTRDAAARLAICNHLPLAECAHFGQHRIAQALYDAVVACYSSPATAALGRTTFSHLTYTVDLIEQHLLAAETSVVAVGAARGTPRTPFFEGCSPSPFAPSYASAAAVDILGAADVGLLLLLVGSATARARVAGVVAMAAGVVVGAAVEGVAMTPLQQQPLKGRWWVAAEATGTQSTGATGTLANGATGTQATGVFGSAAKRAAGATDSRATGATGSRATSAMVSQATGAAGFTASTPLQLPPFPQTSHSHPSASLPPLPHLPHTLPPPQRHVQQWEREEERRQQFTHTRHPHTLPPTAAPTAGDGGEGGGGGAGAADPFLPPP